MQRGVILALLASTVVSLPTSAPSVERVVATVGCSARLVCALGPPSSSLVVWARGERVLFAGSLRVRQDRRLTVEEAPSSALLVAGVEEGDAGQYRCQVEGEAGQLRAGQVELVVHTPPSASILGAGAAVTVREGASLALRCRGHGTPPPLVSWHRVGAASPLAQGRGEVGLLLESLTREDQGELLCRADNGVGQVAEDRLLLDLLYAPEVELLPPSLSPGGACGLELQCIVHSSAAAEVSWYRDGEHLLLPSSPGVAMWSLDSLHVLQLHTCELSLVAEFTCRAESRLGRAEGRLRVTREQLERELARRAEEERIITGSSNTVRRNVEDAQALVSSANLILNGSCCHLLIFAFMLLNIG